MATQLVSLWLILMFFYKTSLYSTSVSNSKFIDPAKHCLVQYKEDVKQEVTHQTNQMKSLLPPKLIGKME
jgi:hypothetical protein